ncbi:hypothetical protein [Arcticibacterium luteifluviistationis]|nr:hypothetical protein [Arcticibacterium luteifluviistationis]
MIKLNEIVFYNIISAIGILLGLASGYFLYQGGLIVMGIIHVGINLFLVKHLKKNKQSYGIGLVFNTSTLPLFIILIFLTRMDRTWTPQFWSRMIKDLLEIWLGLIAIFSIVHGIYSLFNKSKQQ